jgi:hypothetical protein
MRKQSTPFRVADFQAAKPARTIYGGNSYGSGDRTSVPDSAFFLDKFLLAA